MNSFNTGEENKHKGYQIRTINSIVVTGRCYWYKNNYYELLGEVKSKNSITGDWEQHFKYKDIFKKEEYTREKKDFAVKFDKVDKQLLTIQDLKL